MTWLGRRLRRAGHRPHSFGYLALAEDLQSIADRFAERVARVLAEDVAGDASDDGTPPRYAVIGHSLGGIITRYASPRLPDGLDRFVMLTPPNRPPAAALALGKSSLFGFFAGDAGRKLRDPGFFATLPRPDAPTLVVAGDRGPSSPRLPFRGEPNDGVVRLSETFLPGALLVVVHGAHTFVMNRRDVWRAVRQFLETEEIVLPGGGGRGPERRRDAPASDEAGAPERATPGC